MDSFGKYNLDTIRKSLLGKTRENSRKIIYFRFICFSLVVRLGPYGFMRNSTLKEMICRNPQYMEFEWSSFREIGVFADHWGLTDSLGIMHL